MEKDKICIIGAGLYGLTCARELINNNYLVDIYEARDIPGGNIIDTRYDNYYIHKYGAHIFHTSNDNVWNWINRYSEFNNYINTPIANYNGEIYNLPFNMNTFSKLFNIKTSKEAKEIINKEINEYQKENGKIIKNLQDQAISMVGITVFNKLIKEYTEKQWNKDCEELNANIIKRLPLRFVYNNNYFNDKYQGIPINGYTELVNNIIKCNNENPLNIIYKEINEDNIEQLLQEYRLIIYTGQIDKFFNYKYGSLDWRSLEFITKILNIEDFQSNAVVNYTSKNEKYTRIIEHKHFYYPDNLEKTNTTVITEEYPKDFKIGDEAYYPVYNVKSLTLHTKYVDELYNKYKGQIILGGRLGLYKYLDMDDTIESALKLANIIKYKYEILNNIS